MRAILTWHSIDRSGSVISTSPAQFRTQLAWLSRSGVRVRSLPDLLAHPGGVSEVALTFDDGFANFATEALPLLREHRWPATLFVVSRHAGRDNRWRGIAGGVPALPLLDWDALAELPADLVNIGAHTRTHPRLDRLPGIGQIEDEIAGSHLDITERLGREPTIFAYPYGAVSEQAKAMVARTFAWACSTRLRPLRRAEDPHVLPRLDTYYLRQPDRLGGWGSARLRGWIRLRDGGRGVKALLRGEPRP